MNKALIVLTFLFFHLIIVGNTAALQLVVKGNCVGEVVKVYTDRDATIIFQLNNGTPIFSNANLTSPAKFKPYLTGNLLITATSENDIVKKEIDIVECQTTKSGEKTLYSTTTLPSGTFTKTVDGSLYEIEWRTALGALEKASRVEGFSYKLKKTEWGPFVDCIKDVCTGYAGKTSGWMYWVNYPEEPLPGVSADKYRVEPGDEVIWYFSRSMDETPDSSPFKIIITIKDLYAISVKVEWSTKIEPVAAFTYSPLKPAVGETITFNASKSFDPDGEIKQYYWEFGDGKTAEGVVVEHIYNDSGIYEVKLRVVDDDGLESYKTKEIEIRSRVTNVSEFRKQLELRSGEEARVQIPAGLGVPVIEINLKALESGKFKLVVSKAEVPGIIYADVHSCFRIETDGKVRAEITLRVNKSWDDVTLMKYGAEGWLEIPVKTAGEDEDYVYYSAELDSFSVFVVASKWKNFPLDINDSRIQLALKWLRSIQNPDGGFANPGEESSVAKTSWAIMAIVAAGEDPHDWKADGVNGASPVDYLRNNLKEELPKMGTADYARTILALVAAGEDPRSFARVDLVSLLKERVKEDGQIGDFVYTTIWGILALVSVGENVTKSVEWLKAQQNDDGGFAWAVGEKSDFDDTAAAIQALIAAGEPRDSEIISKALEYLKQGQNDDGGMRYFGSSASNAASDSWTIQALVAAGINPTEWKKNNISVVDHLLSLQSDEGYFNYTAYVTDNPGYMTTSAIMALLGKPQPIKILKLNATVPTETTVSTPATTTTAVTTTATTTTVTAAKTVTSATPSGQRQISGFDVLTAIAAALTVARVVRR